MRATRRSGRVAVSLAVLASATLLVWHPSASAQPGPSGQQGQVRLEQGPSDGRDDRDGDDRSSVATAPLFGPKRYIRTAGAPNQFDDRFSGPSPSQTPYVLHVVNGEGDAEDRRVSSATITLNGVDIVVPRDFSRRVRSIDRPVTLAAANRLHVTLAGSPGSYLTITITGTDTPAANRAPVVSAGPNQTITLPAAAALAGSATDDGQPVGAPLVTTWSAVSGPGAVTFANAASPTTTAAFSAAGTYVLRLTATDSLLSTSADVTITVLPAPPINQAPVVSAGGNQTVTLPAAAALAWSATDDGLPVGVPLSLIHI